MVFKDFLASNLPPSCFSLNRLKTLSVQVCWHIAWCMSLICKSNNGNICLMGVMQGNTCLKLIMCIQYLSQPVCLFFSLSFYICKFQMNKTGTRVSSAPRTCVFFLRNSWHFAATVAQWDTRNSYRNTEHEFWQVSSVHVDARTCLCAHTHTRSRTSSQWSTVGKHFCVTAGRDKTERRSCRWLACIK